MAAVATKVERAAVSVQTPLQHIEHALAPWVTFLVVPLFALANAAVDFRELDIAKSLLEPVTLGIALGLVLGKFFGISAFCWLAVRTGLGVLPSGVNWHHMLGAAWLGGIGFTMSLFISQLAFTDPVLADQAKIGILLASLLAALIGSLWLVLAPQRSSTS
jgi:NhaA family Na+:H+ antiporter